MSWLGIATLCGFAVTVSSTVLSPVTRAVPESGASSIAAASIASIATAAAGYIAEAPNEAVEMAMSGAPVEVWEDIITRHYPELNTWIATKEKHTIYQADYDYEPDGWEESFLSKEAAKTRVPDVTTTPAASVDPTLGVPAISFGFDATDLKSDEIPPTPTNWATRVNDTAQGLNEESNNESVEVHPPPAAETEATRTGFGAIIESLVPKRASKVENNARMTRNGHGGQPEITGLGEAPSPTFSVATKARSTSVYAPALWDPFWQQLEAMVVGHDSEGSAKAFKVSLGTASQTVVKIHGATAVASLNGPAVTHKGIEFKVGNDGLHMGSELVPFEVIAPAYPTDFAAVLTIDDRPVTFVKEAGNPTIMTAGILTATLGGPAMTTGSHQILYNSNGALILDGTQSVDPSPIQRSIAGGAIPTPGGGLPGVGIPADAFGRAGSSSSPSGSSSGSGSIGSAGDSSGPFGDSSSGHSGSSHSGSHGTGGGNGFGLSNGQPGVVGSAPVGTKAAQNGEAASTPKLMTPSKASASQLSMFGGSFAVVGLSIATFLAAVVAL